jgi:N6-adenosine-specific RNA methylase IME4
LYTVNPFLRLRIRSLAYKFTLGLLESFLEDDAGKKLELFARNLYPGWTSWGNEPLKFNDSDYFNSSS